MLRNSQLTQLVRDVALEVGPGDLRPVPWDREQIHQLFDTLQFRVLRDRLYSTLPNGIGVPAPAAGSAAAEASAFDTAAVLLGPDEVADWIDGNAAGPGRSGLAARGHWGRGTGSLTGLAIAGPGGTAAFIDPARLTESDDKALGAWLADPDRPKALHDAKGPMHALAARGFELRGADQRHRTGRLPGPAGPAVVRSGRPGAALPEPGAAGRRAGFRAADARRGR